MKKWLCVLIYVIVFSILSGSVSSAFANESYLSSKISKTNKKLAYNIQNNKLSSDILDNWNTDTSVAISKASNWLNNDTRTTEELVIAMGVSGSVANVGATSRVLSSIEDRNGNYQDLVQLEKDILCITFSSLNPTSIHGHNLIKILYEWPNLENADLYSKLFALICYDSNNFDVPSDAKNNRDFILQSILKSQNPDGGFPGELEKNSEIKNTSWAIVALSNYLNNNENVKNCVQSAIKYLSERNILRLKDIEKTSNDLSLIILALTSVGISPSDPRFVYKNQNMVKELIEYQLSSGAFAEIKGNENPSTDSTEIALISLSALRDKKNPFVIENDIDYLENDNVSSIKKILFWSLVIFIILAFCVIMFIMLYLKKRKGKKSV